MSSRISTVVQIDTKYNADSIEWCPINPEYLVCGTYQLIEGTSEKEEVKSSENNSRIGSIILYKYSTESKALSAIQNIPTSAVTDMKWHDYDGTSLLGMTSSSGQLDLYTLGEHDMAHKLKIFQEFDICSPKLSLSLDWGTGVPKATISDSGGYVSIVQIVEGGVILNQKWKGHTFDAWITAYDRWDPNIAYSGGDDCLLKGWDTRMKCCKPIFINKEHTMGVCAIQSNSLVENVFASGGYDEQVYVWDNRSMRGPLTSCDVGGGVWRLKWHPQKSDYLLAACCHSGFHMMKFDSKSQSNLDIIGSYTAHESLAYGADWARSSDDSNGLNEVLATCSFYDHRLDLWEFNYVNKPLASTCEH